jgi:hypothetical protein
MTISMPSLMMSELVFRIPFVFPMQNTKCYELKFITEVEFRKLLEQFYFHQYSKPDLSTSKEAQNKQHLDPEKLFLVNICKTIFGNIPTISLPSFSWP